MGGRRDSPLFLSFFVARFSFIFLFILRFFFAFLRFSSFFLHFSAFFSSSSFFSCPPRTRANDCNLLGHGEFHSDPVCTDPVQNYSQVGRRSVYHHIMKAMAATCLTEPMQQNHARSLWSRPCPSCTTGSNKHESALGSPPSLLAPWLGDGFSPTTGAEASGRSTGRNQLMIFLNITT